MQPAPRRPALPPGLELAVAWTWRLLVLAAGVLVLGLVVQRLVLVVGAVVVGLLLTALLQPLAALLERRGLGRRTAAWLVWLGFLALVAAFLRALGGALLDQLRGLAEGLRGGLEDLRRAVADGPLPLGPDEVDAAVQRLGGAVGAGDAASGALTVASTVVDVLSGALLALFVLLVLLLDGPRVWGWTVGLVPRAGRERADVAGHAAWHSLVGYLRGIGTVALVDATLIAIALLVIGVPFVLPLAALTFLAAFVPYVGASVAGAVAAGVALVDGGPVEALLVVGAVLVVQTVDGYVLEPLVVGKAVHLHPLAVVLAISVGGVLGGVGGAVVAVPLTGAVNAFASSLSRTAQEPAP